MASKALVIFGILLFAALLASSEVAAEQTQANTENKAGTQDYRGGYGPGYGNGGGYGPGYGHGGGYGPGYGHGGGYGPGYGHGGGPGGGGYCRWGCCRRGYRGGCLCCMHPNEIPEPMYIPEVQN